MCFVGAFGVYVGDDNYYTQLYGDSKNLNINKKIAGIHLKSPSPETNSKFAPEAMDGWNTM